MGEIAVEEMDYQTSSTEENQHQILEEIFPFFQLPYPVQIEIVSHLSLQDTKAFSETAQAGKVLSRDQAVWRKKLWHHCKTINLCLEGRRTQPPEADVLVRDPLLVDMKKLYEVLNPPGASENVTREVDRQDFLAKIRAPQVTPFSSVGLQDLLNFLNTFFHRPPPIFYDPFSRGHNAPSFMLFGPPETTNARKLALSFIASKNSLFETVGLVKGKPGGLGGGVTVEFGRRLMNFLPVRRARPRLLVEGADGVEFHPEVAQVVKQVDGLVYYMDAVCRCAEAPQKCTTRARKPSHHPPPDIMKHAWQTTPNSNSSASQIEHSMDSEFYELEAMVRATPELFPPILVVLVRNSSSDGQSHSSDSEEGEGRKKEKEEVRGKLHSPADLQHRMQGMENPWMICNMDVHSLKGVHQGINWLYERTRILKGK